MYFWYCKCLLWRGAVLAINGALGKKEGGVCADVDKIPSPTFWCFNSGHSNRSVYRDLEDGQFGVVIYLLHGDHINNALHVPH